MTRGATGRISALIAVVLAACSLVACGSSGSAATDSAASTEAGSQPNNRSGEKSDSSGSAKSGSQSNHGGEPGGKSSNVEPVPLKVSGGGSAQYRVKGGDNSIQEFGEESDEAELEEAAAALHAFLTAHAEEDWPAACSLLAKTVKGQLGSIASRSTQLKGKGCAGILDALTPSLPAGVRKELTVVDAGSLRIEGDRAFLIYRGAEETDYAMVMVPEAGTWRVGALAGTPIS